MIFCFSRRKSPFESASVMDSDHRGSYFPPFILSERRHKKRRTLSRTSFAVTVVVISLLFQRSHCQSDEDAVLRSQPRFDFSSFSNNHRRHQSQQYQQPLSPPNNVVNNNNHHFQRQHLNSGVDPLHSVSTSNTNANFNSHFTRPYVRTPSSPQFYGPAASNLFSTAEPACGYDSCRQTNPNSLNVHVVCHTHLDTGWVETYDEYYHHCEFMFSVTRLWSHCPLNLHLMILFL